MKQIILSFILIIYSINTFPQYINYNLTNQSETLLSSNNELNLSKMNDTSAFYKSELGFTTGFNWFSLFTPKKENKEYGDLDYLYYYDNYIASVFYIRNYNQILSLGLEIANTATKLKTKSADVIGAMGHKYQDLDYNINYLNFILLLQFNIFSKNKIDININLNPYISYIIYSKVTGYIESWSTIILQDSLGNLFSRPSHSIINLNESPIKDINKLLRGFRIGYDIEYAYKPNVSFLFANYFCYTTSTNISCSNCEGKWRSIAFSLGIIYKFNKSYEKNNIN
ncbi:MAG TPA: hypothetical protein PLS14_00030 [Bacteroidales bacterium]|nr:hypothetical protein [Bacteroidales bacterium]HPZ60382.1 hypothetical protein [Bacteroidales bacterium]HQD57990.1 hypothetical protein [Bacteroidales bacterium]